MKSSIFNIFFTYDDGTILGYNSQTRGLIELDDTEYKSYELLSQDKEPKYLNADERAELIAEFKKGKFLVEDDIDELTQAKASYHLAQFMGKTIALTIVVTHRCNLACSYCYEERQPYSLAMSDIPPIFDIAANLLHERGAQQLHLSWFGGEPLMRPAFIKELSGQLIEHCEKEKIHYRGAIVTNGTLLNRSKASMLRECRIFDAQLTLDGPRSVNDRRRFYPSGKGSFDKILANIKETCDLVNIKIRVNVDLNNVDQAAQILDILGEEGLKDKVMLYFAPVAAYTAKCAPFEKECYTKKEFSEIEVDLLFETIKRGFRVDKNICLPRTSTINCASVSATSLVIDAKRHIHKCWNSIGNENEAIAFLPKKYSKDKRIMLSELAPKKDNLSKWYAYDPFEFEKCRKCNLLPSCMGGCPWHTVGLGEEPQCPTWKFNMKERLWLYKQCLEAECRTDDTRNGSTK